MQDSRIREDAGLIQGALKAFGQLFSLRFLGLLAAGVGFSVLLFWGLYAGVQAALSHLPTLGWSWVNTGLEWIAGGGVVLLSVFLLQPVASLFIGFFLEFIADAVEARHYPDSAAVRDVPLTQSVAVALRFFATMVILNLILLPAYFLPGVNAALFLGLNGYLVGREYFELVALRHYAPAEVKRLRRGRRFYVFAAGIIISIILTVPLVNLIGPLFGTAFMVHIFKDIDRHAA